MNDLSSGLAPIEDKSMFASLKVRDYRYLWIGMLASAFALNMQLVAQGWLVYEMTSSPINLTLVTMAFMVPQVVFSLVGGVLADRVSKKPVIGWTPVINGLATAAMGTIIMFGNVTFWDFVWVGILNGTVLSLSIPARTALIPEIVGEKLMFNAMAFNTASWNLARVLGPALAGFMIAIFAGGDTSSTFGVGLVYYLLSFLYLLSAVTVMFIEHEGKPAPGEKQSPLDDTLEGLTYVINSPVVGGLILLSILPFLFGLTINTLLPAFSTDVLNGGPDDLGLLMTGLGVGAVFGSLAMAKMGNFSHKGYWVIGTGALWGLLVAAFGMTEQFLSATFVIALIGLASAVNMSMNRSLTQLQVEQHMRGRIMSIDMMSHGLMPIGVLPIGYIAETVSIEAGLITSGLILCFSTLLFGVFMPKVRAINQGYH
ncbi:MAG: MFS transporter [Pseudomonadales bacterium]|nr:MFS transporter [Pseudomonadales bacterium]MBO6597665.1 MFS transporter [Pseudomonadales bacterium]MBO6658022.1 MFS transporter [Pseudomonadales bacterium]MBO6703980.1 MFS transporter [Pseudomonadales bacterium]MBO6823903.1 MFS transporter [Pseudomonadales bacterium]